MVDKVTNISQGVQAYKAVNDGQTAKGGKSFFDHVVKDPIQDMIKTQHLQEVGIQQNLDGKLSEDELAMLITQAGLSLQEVKVISERFIQAVHETTKAVGG